MTPDEMREEANRLRLASWNITDVWVRRYYAEAERLDALADRDEAAA